MMPSWRRFSLSLGSLGVVLALVLGGVAAAPPARADSGTQTMGLHFVGTVLQGSDAGVRMEGYLSLTPGNGAQVSGTLATFGGTIMNSRTGYTPIPVTGKLRSGSVTLTFDLSGAGSMSMSDDGAGSAMLMMLSWPRFKHYGAHTALQGTGHALPSGAYVGTFTGPAHGDIGIWTASPAVSHSFDYNAVSKLGIHLSISGQAAVVFEQNGTIEGLYVADDGKHAYPVHGVLAGNRMSLILEMGNATFIYGTGTTDNVDTFQFFTGTFYGPGMTTSGKWSAAFTG